MTRIKRLEIENFKCFQQRTAFDFGKITLLTGANSSGKSSVMYAILGALQSGEFPFQFSTNGRFVDMGDFRDVVFGRDASKRISITINLEGGELGFKCTTYWPLSTENQLPYLDEIIFYQGGEEFHGKSSADLLSNKPHRFGILDVQNSDQGEGISCVNFSFDPNQLEIRARLNQFNSELFKHLDRFLEAEGNSIDKLENLNLELVEESIDGYLTAKLFELRLEFFSMLQWLNFIGSFRLPPSRTYLEQNRTNIGINHLGEGYLEQIIQWELRDKAKYAQLVQTMKDLELLNSIRTKRMEGGRYEMAVRVREDGVETSLTDIGFGVSQFLPIIVADLQLPNGSTLFVSQPETHLHPSVQSSFGDYLVRQANTLDKNYIIETHSEYLLNRIRLAIVKGEIKEEDVSVYYLEPHPDGNISHRVTFDRQGRIHGAPPDFFKTYMMDVMEIAMQAE